MYVCVCLFQARAASEDELLLVHTYVNVYIYASSTQSDLQCIQHK